MPWIILTKVQANQVRGLTVQGHALCPLLLADRNFAINANVLNDLYHDRYWQILSGLPQQANLPPLLDPATLTPIQKQYYDQNVAPFLWYQETWPPGQNISCDPDPGPG